MPDFFLTQRLSRREGRGGRFDDLFACEYMGSAEFEWGAIPDSFKRIRANKKALVIHEGEVTRKGITVPVFVVGHRKVAKSIPDRLAAWLADDWPRAKEITYFPERIEGTASEYVRTDAWWSLGDDVMWALDADTADLLLQGVKA